MIEWAILGAAALGAGGVALRAVRKGRVRRRWSGVLADVAQRTGARGSIGSSSDAPELRTEIDGTTVTLKIIGIEKAPRDGRIVASASLPDNANTIRFYFGWDVLEIPRAVEHIADVPYPPVQRVEGDVKIRADDGAMASRFLREAIVDLIDVRREATAHALEVIVKGGYLELLVHGLDEHPAVLERTARACQRLAAIVDTISRGTTLPAGADATSSAEPGDDAIDPERDAAPSIATDRGPASETDATSSAADATPSSGAAADDLPATTCALCDAARRDDERWVRCASCAAPYHEACFAQATACLTCGQTRSKPL